VSLVCVHFHHTTAGQMTAEMFDVFYRGTVRRLTRYAFGLTGDPGESQDLVQEAYARAWQHWRRVSAYDDAEAWLRLVVNRLAKDRWRRLAVRRAAAAGAPPEPSVPGPSEETVLLVAAMRQLPFDQRQALVLFHLMDRSLADIAAETRTNVSTVKSRLTRGRAALAAMLGTSTVTNAGGAHVNGA
jgi:RNA polymerase sigma-70 factor (ECF subfamily)